MNLSGQAAVAGVMGWPVSQSRSPRLHGFWLRELGIDGAYVPFPVPPAGLARALGALPELGIRGVNVTIPHKETALALVDEADATARRVGALNTIVVRGGRLVGSSTDGFGFLENLRDRAPGFVVAGGPAVVLGAGGAARAIAAALVDAGVPELRLLNRTKARAEGLARAIGGSVGVGDWGAWDRGLSGARLLVNATALGMEGYPPLDIDLAPLPAEALVCDIVYAPPETGLLAAAMARGLGVVDGIGMLLHQARPGFRAWFGVDPPVTDALRRHVLNTDR